MNFHDVNWQEFEAILEELGEKRASRLAYFKGNLEIRVPLPEHEKAKVIIGDLVKFLLDECDRNWECDTPILYGALMKCNAPSSLL